MVFRSQQMNGGLNRVHSASRVQLRSYLKEKVAALVQKIEIMAIGDRCADRATPLYPQKLALTSLTSGGRSVSIVCSWTKATEIVFSLILQNHEHKTVSIMNTYSWQPKSNIYKHQDKNFYFWMYRNCHRITGYAFRVWTHMIPLLSPVQQLVGSTGYVTTGFAVHSPCISCSFGNSIAADYVNSLDSQACNSITHMNILFLFFVHGFSERISSEW
jgi:hypothetical protein